MLEVEVSKAQRERNDMAAIVASADGTTRPLRTVTVTGTVSVTWPDGTPQPSAQPLAGLTVYALRPRVRKAGLIPFYSDLTSRISVEESMEKSQAQQWQQKIKAGTLNPAEEQQWQSYANQDLRKAAIDRALAMKVIGMGRDLSPDEDIAHARLGMLEADHDYAIIKGLAKPGPDFSGDLLGSDFTEVASAARAASSVTDSAGHYVMEQVPEGPGYFYAFWSDGSHAVEWLIPVTIDPAGDAKIDLTLKNAAAVKH